MKKTFLLPIFLVLFIACKGQPVSGTKGDRPNFAVTIKKCAEFSSSKGVLVSCLDSVIADSRCPSDANCVWAGQAVARFSFAHNNERHMVTLQLGPGLPGENTYPGEVSVMGYHIVFKQLAPYPGSKPYNYTDYEASLLITE